jgi:hypothetical protein
MEIFNGKNLGDIYPFPHINLPIYPKKGEINKFQSKVFFYYDDAPVVSRNISASTLIPVAKGACYLILPLAVNIPELFDYYKNVYEESHTGIYDNLCFCSNKEYESKSIELSLQTGNKIVSIVPYINNPYSYVDVEVYSTVQSKWNISQLTNKVAKQYLVNLSNFEKVIETNQLKFPLFVKGNFGSGGNYVRKANSIKDIKSLKIEKFVTEENFQHDINFNIQTHISPEGEISYVGGSTQLLEETVYIGSIIDMESMPYTIPKVVYDIVDEASQNAYKQGWYGLAGWDILYRKEDDKAILIDPNLRWNGATTFMILAKSIAQQTGRRYILLCSIISRKFQQVSEGLNQLKKYLNNGDLFIKGGSYRNDREGYFNLRIGITGNDIEELHEKRHFFEKFLW